MHLLQAGVNLIYIRAILGHVSVITKEIYSKADSKQKRDALEKAYVDVNPNEEAMWLKDENLINLLKDSDIKGNAATLFVYGYDSINRCFAIFGLISSDRVMNSK